MEMAGMASQGVNSFGASDGNPSQGTGEHSSPESELEMPTGDLSGDQGGAGSGEHSGNREQAAGESPAGSQASAAKRDSAHSASAVRPNVGRGVTSGSLKSGGPRRGRWSQAELARLRGLYGVRDNHAIARELGRPVQSVRRMAETIFPKGPRTGPWSAEEVGALKKYLGVSPTEVISRLLGREPEEVHRQIEELGRFQSNEEWTRDEVAEFKRIYGTRTDEDLARIFGRNVQTITDLGEKLALAKDKAFLRKLNGKASTRMPRWKQDELVLLREIYPTCSNLEIAGRLNRSVKSVVSKAHNLGLKKEPERLRQMGRENVSLRYQD